MKETAEILFENRFVQTQEITKEVFFDHYYRRTFYLVADALLLVAFLINLCFGHPTSLLGKLCPLLIGGVFWGYKLQSYRGVVNGTINRNSRAVNGGDFVCRLRATKQGLIYTDNAGSRIDFGYGDVARVRCTRQCIVLQSTGGILYVCKKDAFTTGDAEGFLALLREKNIRGA